MAGGVAAADHTGVARAQVECVGTHGQLNQYFYALGLEFPMEFSDWYALG